MALNVHVIKCLGPPTIAPTELGQHWVDTLNGKTYLSIGTASVNDWLLVNGGGNTVITKVMNCATSVVIDDLVFQSDITNNLAVTATNNSPANPVIGHVLSKSTTTSCTVQLKGVLSVTVGRGRVFLSSSGGYTNSPPTTGFLQLLGWSCGDGRVEINPNLMRVKRA